MSFNNALATALSTTSLGAAVLKDREAEIEKLEVQLAALDEEYTSQSTLLWLKKETENSLLSQDQEVSDELGQEIWDLEVQVQRLGRKADRMRAKIEDLKAGR